MVVSVTYELQSFFAALIIGMVIGILFDFFRSIRAVKVKSAISDTMMWVITILISAQIWYTFQNGEIRWYMILGTGISLILYFLLISRITFCVLLFCVRKIYYFFNIILKLLLTPIDFLCKILGVYIKKAKNKFSGKVEDKSYEKKACI